jgi:hypothetical protein
MRINRLLKDGKPAPEDIEKIRRTPSRFDRSPLSGSHDPITEIVARKVIEIGRTVAECRCKSAFPTAQHTAELRRPRKVR